MSFVCFSCVTVFVKGILSADDLWPSSDSNSGYVWLRHHSLVIVGLCSHLFPLYWQSKALPQVPRVWLADLDMIGKEQEERDFKQESLLAIMGESWKWKGRI